MNHTPQPTAPAARARRDRALFFFITVMLMLAVAANMILIFSMSAEDPAASGDRSQSVTDAVVDIVYPELEQRPPEEQISILSSLHHIIRELAHFTEFACLGFLSTLLVRHLASRIRALRLWLQCVIPVVFCLLYAISDEVHQHFTGRGPALKDVLIDLGGSISGALLAWLLLWLGRRILRAVAAHRGREAVSA